MAKSFQVKLKTKIGDAPAGYVVQVTVNSGVPNATEVKAALIKAGFKVTASFNQQSFEVM
jgi:hypothetical protein